MNAKEFLLWKISKRERFENITTNMFQCISKHRRSVLDKGGHACSFTSVVSDSLQPHGLYVAYQAPPSMGFSRQEYWSGLPFPSPLIKAVGHK